MVGLSPKSVGFETELSGAFDLTHPVSGGKDGRAVLANQEEGVKRQKDLLVALLFTALAEELPLSLTAIRAVRAGEQLPVRVGQRRRVEGTQLVARSTV